MTHVESPAPRAAWRSVLAGDERALPEQVPEWTDALCAHGPYADASRLYTFADGRRFVLPLLRRTGPLGAGGWLMSYPPACGFGGLVGSGFDPTVARTVLDDLRSTKNVRVSLRPDPTRWSPWLAASDGVTLVRRRAHVVDLSGGTAAVWERLSQSARRGTRLAERAGIGVTVGYGGDLLEDYHRLHLLSVDRWAAHQHEPRSLARARARRRDPLAKLQSLATHLGENFAVTMAYSADRPVSAAITLLGRTAHYTRGAMDREQANRTRAGDLVQWRTLQLACERGCTAFHMGESGLSSNLAQFKEKFGAVAHDYAELRLERIPWTRVDGLVRSAAKKVLGFRDV